MPNQDKSQQIFLPDDVICDKEILLYNDLLSSKDSIVKAAAKKLDKSGKYDDDLTKISAAINKLFPAFSSSTISIALDEKYKRNYATPESSESDDNNPQTPCTQLEEYLFLLEDNLQSFTKSIRSLIKKSYEDEDLQKDMNNIFVKSVHSFHKNIDDFIDDLIAQMKGIKNINHLIDYIKVMGMEIGALEKDTDIRTMLDDVTKMGLKMQLTTHHFKDIGSMAANSAKWLSKLNSNPNFAAFLTELKKCPECGFDYKNFIKRAKTAESKNTKSKKKPESK